VPQQIDGLFERAVREVARRMAAPAEIASATDNSLSPPDNDAHAASG